MSFFSLLKKFIPGFLWSFFFVGNAYALSPDLLLALRGRVEAGVEKCGRSVLPGNDTRIDRKIRIRHPDQVISIDPKKGSKPFPKALVTLRSLIGTENLQYADPRNGADYMLLTEEQPYYDISLDVDAKKGGRLAYSRSSQDVNGVSHTRFFLEGAGQAITEVSEKDFISFLQKTVDQFVNFICE